jgi:NADH dehydrogenase
MEEARIVIVGAGFAGVTLAEHLNRHVGREVQVVVISSDNHMVFTPMLAEVAGRSLGAFDVLAPGRQMAPRARWLTASVTGVDLSKNEVEFTRPDGKTATLSYSHLVLACGSAVNLNAVPGMAAHAYSLRTAGDGVVLGNEVIGRFEQAAVEPEGAERQRLLTVVVVGGGFTGVEAAGHIFDLMRNIKPFYPQLSKDQPRMVLLQRDSKIVPEFQHDSLSDFALRKLRENGLDVRLNSGVEEVAARDVRVASGERFETGLTVCSIGTAPVPLIKKIGLRLERGRLKTEADMQVRGTAKVWAFGDCSAVPNAWNGQISPPTAQFALRQAKQLGANLVRVQRGEATKPFQFRPQGLLATIGHHNGVAEIYSLSRGLAWVALLQSCSLWQIEGKVLRPSGVVPLEKRLLAEDSHIQSQAQCGCRVDLRYFLQAQRPCRCANRCCSDSNRPITGRVTLSFTRANLPTPSLWSKPAPPGCTWMKPQENPL